jgi:hypothetical protein
LAVEETNGDVYMMESILPGSFTKYIGNQGKEQNQCEGSATAICMALVHWSLTFSHGDFMITDVQGILSTSTDCCVFYLHVATCAIIKKSFKLFFQKVLT